ncbi:MAG: TonB-dependent receptor [Acidobacteriota bacterium]
MFRLLCSLFFALLVTVPAKAQIGRASVLGNVTDPSGAAVSGAAVLITHVPTGTVFKGSTTASGLYQMPGLPVGEYRVEVELQGFRRAVRTLLLQVDDSTRLDFQLEIGNVVETLEVREAAPLVDTASATVGKVIENQRMTSLPINGRSAMALVILTPNVRSHAVSAHGFADRGLLITAFSVNGGPAGMNNITIDGATNINARAGDTNVNPGVDSVQEFKVQSGVMSAEYGYTAGGVVNMVTKSGTNQFHGSLYEFLRNDKLDSRNFFAASRAPFRYNQYGGAVGGPVRRDHTFFFFNLEEWKFRRYYTTIGTVPTEAERRGDFSLLRDAAGVAIPIHDPQTTRANPAGSGFVRDVFPSNRIPSGRLDGVAQNIVNYFPLPNRTPTNAFTNSNNYRANLSAARDARQLAIKIDHRFTAKNLAFFRYLLWNHKDDNGATGESYFSAPEARLRQDDYTNRNFSFGDSHFFSSALIHDFRFNVARQYFPFAGAGAGKNLGRQLGLPASVPDITIPRVVIPEVQAFPGGFAGFQGTNAMDTFQLGDSLTHLRGKHALKFGAEIRRLISHSNSCSACSGTFNFNSRLTANPQRLAGTGSGLASFVLGAAATASAEANLGLSYLAYAQAYFFQDDWKISRRLTLNIGFRYDYQQLAAERNNGITRFNGAAVNPETGLPGRMEYAGRDFGRRPIDPDHNDFSPRIGFAFDMFGNSRTVLRGGYGIYYPLTFIYARLFSAFGFRSSTTYQPTGGNLDFPAFQFSSGFPFPVTQPAGAALGPSAFISQNVSFDEAVSRTPYSQQFTFTVQHQLPGGFLVETGYSGNKGTKLGAGNYDYNQLAPQHLSLGRSLNDRVDNPYSGRVAGAFGAATITRQQLLRPFPYYGNISVITPRMASSIYHSFLINLERRMSKGLVLLASYTFGKAISDGIFGYSQAGTEQVNILDYQDGKYDRRSERAVDSTDSAGRFVFSGVYELPIGPGRRWNPSHAIARQLAGGWQANGVLTLQSGLPIVVRGANNFLATRPNSTGRSAKLERPGIERWFDTTQFVNPPDFTYGDLGRTLPDVRSPGLRNIDFSLIKNTRIHERVSLQFRAEAFNLLNHANFLAPNATFVAGADGRNRGATFGTITSARDARIVQLALKLIF